MSMTVRTIGNVPGAGFAWYLLLIEGPFKDEIRAAIDQHFEALGHEAGSNVLVVRGYDKTAFRDSLAEAEAFYGDARVGVANTSTYLLVTDAVPQSASQRNGLDSAKVMMFSISELFEEKRRFTDFLGELLIALHSPNAAKALDDLSPSALEQHWSWLKKYVEVKPSFFGFKANVDAAISDTLKKFRRQSHR